MFEGSINQVPAGEDRRGGLRALDWGELVARLGAARDVRSMFARAGVGKASFSPLALTGLGFAGSEERGVNPDALAGGKRPEDKMARTGPEGAPGERELR